MEPLSVLVLGLIGAIVSWAEERYGKFQDLSPRAKQLTNAVLAFLVPVIVTWLGGVWRPEFGDLTEFVNSMAALLVPAVIWFGSQVGHYLDKWLNKVSG